MNKTNQIRTGSDVLTLVSRSEAKRIVSLSIPTEADTAAKQKYLDSNLIPEWLCVNTWLQQIEQKSVRTMFGVKSQLLNFGLPYTIKVADELADAIIHQESCLSDMEAYSVWYDCFANIGEYPDAKREVLNLLRYPKRWSPAYQTDVQQAGIDAFLELNRSRRMINQPETVDQYTPTVSFDENYFVADIASEVEGILEGTYYEELMGMSDAEAEYSIMHNEECFFSNGSTAEFNYAEKTFLNKLKALKDKCATYIGGILYPLSKRIHRPHWWEECVVAAVPKSFKTPRIIAKEPVWRNFFTSGLRKVIIDGLKHLRPDVWYYFDIENQDYNRDLAFESSIDERYATVDIKSASDSISAALGCTIFKLFAKIPWLRAAYMKVGEEYYPCNIFLTSGHPMTFFCETLFYYAVAIVATKYSQLFYDKRHKFLPPRVFGDDVLIDWRAFDMFVSILLSLNIKVNVEKSFTQPSDYRESCGVEYLKGYPMHGVKWPRTTFDWTKKDKLPDYVASLCTLQHALYGKCWKAADFLCEVIRDLEPKMTVDRPYCGGETIDVWSDVLKITAADAPHSTLVIKETVLDDLGRPVLGKDKKPKERVVRDDRIVWENYKLIQASTNHTSVYYMSGVDEDDLYIHPERYQDRILNINSSQWTECLNRQIHAVLKPQYQPKKELLVDPDLELALYVHFLKNGPVYASRLDELLKISEPIDRKPLVCNPTNRWVTIRR